MNEKVIKIDNHERDEVQPKFNYLSKNKGNQSGIDVSSVPLSHLRSYAILRCGSISNFSRRLGVEKSMGSKILSGYYIPKKTSTIEKISEVLGINSVVVTKIFLNLQRLEEQ